MNFASLNFAWFLPLALIGYWSLPKIGQKNNFLLLISYFFYGCWDVRFLLLIWLLTGTSYYFGAKLAQSQPPGNRKLLLKVYVIFSLGVLGVFKYFNFFIETAEYFLDAAGISHTRTHLTILLPAAISFFTFESLSYVIEIYHNDLKRQPKLRDYALFIAFFPKLVAGPIERPGVLLPQLERERAVGSDEVSRGFFLILLGLFKKIAIADGLAPAVDSIYGSPQVTSATDIALATLAFTVQIYCDFSGYTDIARGVSKLFGLELSQNFRFPYFSSGPSEFWRRWHISLSTWLRDYLYIPLGGNRGTRARERLNLMLTMALGGLWHGAAWNYILWGTYQGALLVGYKVASTGHPQTPIAPSWVTKPLKTALFFCLMSYGWLLFRANSMEQAFDFTRTLIQGPYPSHTNVKNVPFSAWLGTLILVIHDAAAYKTNSATFYRQLPPIVMGALCASLLFATFMGLANSRSAFIYFQF